MRRGVGEKLAKEEEEEEEEEEEIGQPYCQTNTISIVRLEL